MVAMKSINILLSGIKKAAYNAADLNMLHIFPKQLIILSQSIIYNLELNL